MKDIITFNSYPMDFKLVGDEVFITCKNVTGTLTQIEKFRNNKLNRRCYFGECKVRNWRNKMVKIDCLEDTREKIELIYKHAKEIKDGK